MADLSAAGLLAELNTRLRDVPNRTFTAEEKTLLIKEAIRDRYVATPTRDANTTTAASTYNYTLPTGFTEVYDLRIDINGDGIGQVLPRDVWDVIGDQLYIQDRGIPTGKVLIIDGYKKLDVTDLIPDNLQNYVLTLAQIGSLELLKTTLAQRFLTNDMTMSDITQSLASHERRAEGLRASIANQRLVTL